MKNSPEKAPDLVADGVTENLTKCGVIMPIAALDGCSASHWVDVLEIIKESLEDTAYRAEIVSSSADTTIIHKTIVKNLYENEIVVCDVSGRNPNVMLELGMRLAFDKPVVVIKDDSTPYSFDTSPIEHLEYPRDLRFPKIKDFKAALRAKVVATHAESKKQGYSFFLKDYPNYVASSIPQQQVPAIQMLLAEFADVKALLSKPPPAQRSPVRSRFITWASKYVDEDKFKKFASMLDGEGRSWSRKDGAGGMTTITIDFADGEDPSRVHAHYAPFFADLDIPF